MSKVTQDQLVAFLKNQAFVFQASEIYGGIANGYDYGPNGVELKNNLKKLWWKEFVQKDQNIVGLDSAIIQSPKVWEASGHLSGFSDPLIDCKECGSRFRADKLIEEFDNQVNAEVMNHNEMEKYIIDNNINCPNCQKCNYTSIREFNLMFKTNMGVLDSDDSKVYLRPETAQGIFTNYKNVMRLNRQKIPFGIAQIGKSFRNEITPGNFIFRTREFEQMEIEYFVHHDQVEAAYNDYQNKVKDFLIKVGLKSENLVIRHHDHNELSHYSNATVDFEYKFLHGQGELWGIACRGNFDLTKHQEYSKQDLTYQDPQTNEKYLPHVIEPSVGVDRLMLAILSECYEIENIDEDQTREVLRLPEDLAPIKYAIMPLQKQQLEEANNLFKKLSEKYNCLVDASGSIGKRYRRQDAIGTPYCITIDFDTEKDGCVTVRDRDTMEQTRVSISSII